MVLLDHMPHIKCIRRLLQVSCSPREQVLHGDVNQSYGGSHRADVQTAYDSLKKGRVVTLKANKG